MTLFCSTSHSRRSGMDYTVLPAITPMPAFTSQGFTRWRLPRLRTSNCSLLLIYIPRKDEFIWLVTYSGRFTHIYVVTRQLQVERRTRKVRRSKTNVLPLCHATNKTTDNRQTYSVTPCETIPTSML